MAAETTIAGLGQTLTPAAGKVNAALADAERMAAGRRATDAPSEIAALPARMEPPATYAALAALFGALADPTRARIVHLLMGREWSTSEIAALTGATAPATSQHLRVLRRLRLVRSHRAGRWVYYRLDDAHVALLMRTSLEHLRDAGAVTAGTTGDAAEE